MLSYLSGDYATGIYNASYKIITVLTTFFPVYQAVVFPLMSKLFEGSNDLLKLSYVKSVKYLLLIIMPITLGISLYATPLVTLIYGSEYLMSGPVMQVLVWTVGFLFVNGAASTLLNASNKEVSVTKIYCVAALFNVCFKFKDGFIQNIFIINSFFSCFNIVVYSLLYNSLTAIKLLAL